MIKIPVSQKPEHALPIEKISVSPKEAAQMLSISERSLFDLTKKGCVKAVKVGRRTIYSVAELHRFANGQ